MLNWNINPILLDLGPLEIRYYGLFFAIGLFLAYSLARHMAKVQKLNLDKLDTLVVYLIAGLILGARFGHILFYSLDYYLANPGQILQIWNGGLSSHGAAIGVLVAYGLFLWQNKKIKFFDYGDIIAIVATLPVIFVRMGNFFNSEIVGRVAENLPWAVTFERVDSLPRHPSQIYESLLGILILALLYPLWKKKHQSVKPGHFTGLFFVLYFGSRFLVEFVKEYPLHSGLTTGQWLSIPFVAIGLGILINQKR